MDDAVQVRLRGILERCYATLEDGADPDLDSLCGADVALRERVEHLLARERSLVEACRSSSDRSEQSHPRQLGEFRVLELLGVGGMSQVYRARQEPLGREVALKVLRADLVATATGRLRFQREAAITAALDHPNIVPVYAAGTDGEHVYLAMKLLRGHPLDRLPAALTLDAVAKIGVDAASALQAAHDIGVVHRDVKPANVMVEGGVAFVLDFGLSSFVHSTGVLTRADTTPGTLVYLAPETVRRRHGGLDPRVDVYSLGATLYELLAGRPPFDAGNPVRLVHQILHHEPRALHLRGRDRDLETIVRRAMDKSPSRRFQTAGEMAEELQRFRDGLPIRSRPLGWPARLWRLAARHRAAAALATAAVLLGAMLLLVLSLQARDRTERRARELAAARTAIDAGDVFAAQQHLDDAVRLGDDARSAELRVALSAERSVQALIGCLQAPHVHQDPRVVAQLVRSLETSGAAVLTAPRGDAVLALGRRLVRDASAPVHPLGAATRARWPRTTAALAMDSRGDDPEPALRALPASDPWDHLFAALAMRIDHRPARTVELELRMPLARGAAGEALRYSIAIALEAQSQHLAAFDLLGQLLDSAVYAPLAASDRARMAAHLGRREDAQRLLDTARAASQRAPHFLPLLPLAELDVLLELGGGPAFWQRWRAAAATHGHLAAYWLRGGYAAFEERGDDAAAPERARQCFVRGLECTPDPARRSALEVALLTLDWDESPASRGFEPLPDDVANDAERERLAALSRRALDVAERAIDAGLAPTHGADALLIAANARRAIGDRATGWTLLERACRDHADPVVFARFAYQVGFRVMQVHFEGSDGDAQHGPPLAEAAAKGMLRARDVVDRAAVYPVADGTLRDARAGLFLCALQLEDPEQTLPAALVLRDETDVVAAPVLQLVELAIAGGGLNLARLREAADGPPSCAKLDACCSAVERAIARGALRRDEARTAIRGWREAAAAAHGAASAEPWRAWHERIDALERRLAAPPAAR